MFRADETQYKDVANAVVTKQLQQWSSRPSTSDVLPDDYLPEMVALGKVVDEAVREQCDELKKALVTGQMRSHAGDALDGIESAFDVLPVLPFKTAFWPNL